MLFFYPKEKLENCPRGFNVLPLVETEEPGKYRSDLSLTPFYDYEKDVISISDARYIKREDTVELLSYLLLRHKDDWLVIDSKIAGDDGLRAGLLNYYVNRGDETRIFSYNFSAMHTGMKSGEKAIAVLGYIVREDSVIFVNRFDFDPNQDEPKFINKNCNFIRYSTEDFFSDKLLKQKRLDDNSRFVVSSMSDMLTD